ncbi:hypothetical protein H5410_040492 [Solanum commersonii]|uniref:Uncharacterized protein n=1 Tax=Solanum commersonii TaxID=4109 RepID=A0A9J5XQA8_SOLCO|nr:hypothetical protein H5410_040492 [Solanum commersonii]
MDKNKKGQRIFYYSSKGIIADSSVRHIARKIFIQDGDKEEMINNYLEEVKRNTSMRSETSDDVADDIQEAQPIELEKTTSKETLKKRKISSVN